jgi:hypothetical protein
MFPGIYEFRWDAGHLIFLGSFYAVLLILGSSLALAACRARADLRRGVAEGRRWKEEFSELPPSRRTCRHGLTGEAPGRSCSREFDCAHCPDHLRFRSPTAGPGAAREERARDFPGFSSDRFYHRGHAWARGEADGTVTVGLDRLGLDLLGPPDPGRLPSPGHRLSRNGTAWIQESDWGRVRILSPVEGEVVERGAPGRGWLLRVRPSHGTWPGPELLRGAEIRPWILRELEWLQTHAGGGAGATLMADGGSPVSGPAAGFSAPEQDNLLGALFLNA